MKNYLCTGLKPFITIAAIGTAIITSVLIDQIRRGSQEVPFDGIVVSESDQCSEIGQKIMKEGGNAVDAVLATSFCLAVTCPHYLSLMGGGFMIIHKHKLPQKTTGLEFWPALSQSFDLELSSGQAKHAGIPGLVRGFEMAHKLHGKLPWVDVIKPSIALARLGFQPIPSLITSVNLVTGLKGLLYDMMHPNNSTLKNDTILHNVALARTLEGIALRGSQELYSGLLTPSIVKQLQDSGAQMAMSDFSDYNATMSDLIRTGMDRTTFYTLGSPSSGGLLMSLLKLLVQKNQTSLEKDPIHLVREMMQLYKKYFVTGGTTSGVTVIGADSEELDVVFSGGLGSLFGSGIMTKEGLVVNDALKGLSDNHSGPFTSLIVVMGVEKELCGRRTILGGTDLGYTLTRSFPILLTKFRLPQHPVMYKILGPNIIGLPKSRNWSTTAFWEELLNNTSYKLEEDIQPFNIGIIDKVSDETDIIFEVNK